VVAYDHSYQFGKRIAAELQCLDAKLDSAFRNFRSQEQERFRPTEGTTLVVLQLVHAKDRLRGQLIYRAATQVFRKYANGCRASTLEKLKANCTLMGPKKKPPPQTCGQW
jgi:hypothetical protein